MSAFFPVTYDHWGGKDLLQLWVGSLVGWLVLALFERLLGPRGSQKALLLLLLLSLCPCVAVFLV